MNTDNLQTRAQVIPNPAALFNDVILFKPIAQGKVDVNLGDRVETIDPLANNEKYYTFRATDDELRALLHQLKHYFREGKDETYVDGKLEAVENHLEDMRALVYDYDVTKRGLIQNVEIPQYERKIDSRTGEDFNDIDKKL